jgi:hypothetical protein
MATKQIIDCAYGKANLEVSLSTYAALKLEKPFSYKSAVLTGRQISGSRHDQPIGPLSHSGGIVSQKVEHDNGVVIIMQTQWKRNGSPIRDASLFVRLRAGAPLYSIIALLPTGRGNTFGDRFQFFCGMGDILTLNELKVAGYEVPNRYADNYMNPEEIGECFIVNKLRDQTQAKPTLTAIATAEGIQMKEVAQAPARRLRLQKRQS